MRPAQERPVPQCLEILLLAVSYQRHHEALGRKEKGHTLNVIQLRTNGISTIG
jgi:hypothetical protein